MKLVNLKEWVEEVFGSKFANKVDEDATILIGTAEEAEAGDDEEEEEGEEEEEEPEEEGEEEEEEGEEEDLMELGKIADSKKKSDERLEAQTRLTELAEEVEFDTESVETWTEVAEGIIEAQGGEAEEEEEGEEEEEAVEPTKGETVAYKPPRSRSTLNFKVVKVNKKDQTADLKGKDGKIIKGVDWIDLEYDEE